MRSRPRRLLPLVLLLSASFAPSAPLEAQGIWSRPPENLRVLPEGTTPAQLRSVMQSWTGALGVRCSYCHVAPEGAPLSEYDFPSDENPMKERARTMVRMLQEIRGHLAELEPSGTRVEMSCTTCHAGRPRPQTLREALSERMALEGPTSVLPFYLELREEYFGGAALDFRPQAVDAVARALHAEGAAETAFELLELNAEQHPDWAGSWATMGALAAEEGEVDRARELYRRALEIDPENQQIQRALAQLGG